MELTNRRPNASQLAMKRFLPSEVLIPEDSSSELKLRLILVKIAIDAADAASWKMVARTDVITLAMITRGAQQLMMLSASVAAARIPAKINPTAMPLAAVPYEIEGRKSEEKDPSSPVLSSFRSSMGLKWYPNSLVLHFVSESPALPCAQDEKRDTVYSSARPKEAAVASEPTRSVPVRVERSWRKVEFASLDWTSSPAVLV